MDVRTYVKDRKISRKIRKNNNNNNNNNNCDDDNNDNDDDNNNNEDDNYNDNNPVRRDKESSGLNQNTRPAIMKTAPTPSSSMCVKPDATNSDSLPPFQGKSLPEDNTIINFTQPTILEHPPSKPEDGVRATEGMIRILVRGSSAVDNFNESLSISRVNKGNTNRKAKSKSPRTTPQTTPQKTPQTTPKTTLISQELETDRLGSSDKGKLPARRGRGKPGTLTKASVKAKLTSDAESKNRPSTNTWISAIGPTEAPLAETKTKTTTKTTPTTMMTKTMRAMDESTEREKDGRSSFRTADRPMSRKSREREAEEREKEDHVSPLAIPSTSEHKMASKGAYSLSSTLSTEEHFDLGRFASFGISRESTTSYMEYVKQFVTECNTRLSDAAIQAIQSSWLHVKTVGFQFFGHLLFSFWLGNQPRALDTYCLHYHGDKRKGVVPLLPRFQRLGEIYAKRIDTWVSHLDDPYTLFLILYEHGFNHAKKAVDINEKDFELMVPSLMDAISNAMGSKMTHKLFEQWKCFWKYVLTQIAEGLKGYKEEDHFAGPRVTIISNVQTASHSVRRPKSRRSYSHDHA